MSEPAGVIHDIGYQRYDGELLSRGAIVRAMYVHSIRAAFGLGRTAKAKVFPWLVAGSITLAAVVMAVLRVQLDDGSGEFDGSYSAFADTMSWLVILSVAVAAPELVSRDLRSGVPALYFSRPLRAADYVLAKLLALASTVWLLLGAPQLLIFAIAGFSVDGGADAIWDEVTELVPGLLYAVIWAAVFSSIALVVASFTGKRAFAAGGIVAAFLVTVPVVAVLASLPSQAAKDLAGLCNPTSLVQGVWMWVYGRTQGAGLGVGDYGPLYAVVTVALVAVCVALLLLRFGKVARR